MDKEKFDKSLNKTVESIKDYINLKKEYYSLVLLERLAKVLTRFVVVITTTMLLFFFLLFLSFAFVGWFQHIAGSQTLGYVVIAFIYLVIGALVVVFKKQLFLNPLIKGINSIFTEEEETFENPENKKNNEEETDK